MSTHSTTGRGIDLVYSSDEFQVFVHPGGSVDLFALTDAEPCLFLRGSEASTLIRSLNAIIARPSLHTSADRYLARYFGEQR